MSLYLKGIISTFFCLFCLISSYCLTLEDSLVAHYLFNESSGNTAYDLKGNYNGTINDATKVTWSDSGKFNGCLDFSNDSGRVNLGSISELDSVSAFSISLWVNFDAIDSYNNGIFNMTLEDESKKISINAHGNGNLYANVYNGANQRGIFDLSEYVSANQWYLMTMVFDGTGATNSDKLKFYVDTTEITLTYEYGPMPTTTSDLTGAIAYIGKPVSNSHLGLIDECLIYNRAISAQEVKKIYSGKCEARWSFDEGTGTTVYDQMSDYDGTFSNDTTIINWDNSGIDSNCIEFITDTARVNFGYIPEFDSVKQFTICGWVNFDSYNFGNGAIFHCVKDAESKRVSIWISAYDYMFAAVYNGNNNRGKFDYSNYLDNQWHQITMVFDGTKSTDAEKLKFYVDTTQVTLTFEYTPMPSVTANLSETNSYLGHYSGSPSYTGKLDHWEIYNRPLPLEEIKRLFKRFN